MLTFENVVKEFRLDDQTILAPVNGVDLKIEPGEFVVVVGRSGSGKTTLLNLAAGLVRPTRGRVLVEGNDLDMMTDRQISELRSRKMGFVFQFPSLLPALTVKENVRLPSVFANRPRDSSRPPEARAQELLSMLGLKAKLNVYPRQLSAGEQKRVVIARSLVNQPQIVLADEPTSDLDDRTEGEIMSVLRSINKRGVTFVIVTHSPDLISFADRAFEMEDGKPKRLK